MTVRATQDDLDRLAASLDDVVEAAEVLERQAQSRGGADPEGAVELREIAAGLAVRARAGELGGDRGPLPLSRPFGEWSYGEPVWRRIDAARGVWEERLGGGDFEVVR